MDRLSWKAILAGAVVAVPIDFVAGFLLSPSGVATVGFLAVVSAVISFLAYLLGGFIAGRVADGWGGLNGFMTTVAGFFLAIVLGIIVSIVGVATGSFPTQPEPSSVNMAGALIAGVVSFLLTFVGGYLGGKLGERRSSASGQSS